MAIPSIDPYPMPRPDELPANTADWAVDADRAVLLVHDMQHYFLDPFGRNQEPVDSLLSNVAALRDHCVRLGVPVVHSAQPGDMSPEDRGLLQDFWGAGMSAAPEHRGIPEQVAPREGGTVLPKWRASAFHRTGLLDLLREQGRDQLILCGVYASVGILLTACDAFAHTVQPFVTADAVADFTEDDHRMALRYAAGRCGSVLPTATVLDQLGAGAAATAGAGSTAAPGSGLS